MKVFARGGRMAAAALLAVAAGCGGGGDAPSTASSGSACTVAAQNEWLRGYMSDWYLWSGASPSPDPAGYGALQPYFEALLFQGDESVPGDRWSHYGSSTAFELFFEEGRTLGYGVFVNGNEGTLPLKIRYVEPLSPAAQAGLKRGDVIVSLNGRSAQQLVASGDFSMLSPSREGLRLSMQVTTDGATKTISLTATTHELQPVSAAKVLTLGSGAKAGYLVLKDFITQAEAPMAAAFEQFRAAGATELILDLRYNGGGRVSTSAALASLVSGVSNAGATFTRLKFNDRHQDANIVYPLMTAPGPAFSRVIVLTGPRTCSASELLVNGLKPYAEVVTIGATTCGKPFGFVPTPSCGNTFNAVNFESFNALDAGRYYAGIAATCAAADDFSGELGDPAEALTAAASAYLETGACPATAQQRSQPLSLRRARRGAAAEPGDWQGMRAD